MVPAHVFIISISPAVWITVIVVLVVVFGAAKLPDIARNVGKSAKVLKNELSELAEENHTAAGTQNNAASAKEESGDESDGAQSGSSSIQQLKPESGENADK